MVYELENRPGPRIESVEIRDEPDSIVKTGAIAFTEDDWRLNEAMRLITLKLCPKSVSLIERVFRMLMILL